MLRLDGITEEPRVEITFRHWESILLIITYINRRLSCIINIYIYRYKGKLFCGRSPTSAAVQETLFLVSKRETVPVNYWKESKKEWQLAASRVTR